MTFYSLVLTPKDENNCVKLFSQHGDTLCEKCGIQQIIVVDKPLHLTMAVLDIDYGAFIRRSLSCDKFECESPYLVLNNRFKFTLKIKSSGNSQEVIICHLHEGNKYQSNIDLHLSSGSSFIFSCQQTCSIHLTGYYLN
ncbi:Hypothetical protein CINCED_3A019979 [Cinara cedri]|uniref:Nucleoplasmin-like domain-containing protein n=1 Tax=Cinara cedri TaxID=506608 RepID=A0A5E4LYD6_9HEMI|nr:Hypothetical protein CINCED_3A019979 [Cinara cedri]